MKKIARELAEKNYFVKAHQVKSQIYINPTVQEASTVTLT